MNWRIVLTAAILLLGACRFHELDTRAQDSENGYFWGTQYPDFYDNPEVLENVVLLHRAKEPFALYGECRDRQAYCYYFVDADQSAEVHIYDEDEREWTEGKTALTDVFLSELSGERHYDVDVVVQELGGEEIHLVFETDDQAFRGTFLFAF